MSEEEFQKLVLSEFRALRQEMQESNSALRQEMQESNSALRQEMQEGNSALDQKIQEGNNSLRQEIQDLRLEMRDRFDRLERHSEENVQATLNVIHDKVSDIRESLRSVSEVLGDHELRIRNIIRRPV